MAGIQVSGLLTNSAFDWKSIVDQLIEVSRTPIKKLEAEKVQNTTEAEALATLGTALTALQDSVQAMRADEVFAARTVTSDLAATTWKSSSVTGAAIGSYVFDVTQLATQSQLRGATDIGSGLAATADVSGLTISNLATATAVTAGTFTVAGAQVEVELTDSLQDVFDKIATATGSAVTAAYNPATDKITLTKASGELVLGAANDTTNFLAVMKLANSGGAAATSAAALGAVKTTGTLASAGLRTAITAVDGSGNGSFTINGVAVSYNVNTDTFGALISNINAAGAGVTAAYDSTTDRVILTNTETGDVGITVSEAAGGLMDALGLSTTGGGTLARGKNAEFYLNGSTDKLTSTTNTLDATVHGVSGLSVTVNSLTEQTLHVESDTLTMQTAIEDFIGKFNEVQDLIEESTAVTVSGTTVSTSVLSGNREVESWASELRSLAFDEVSGLTGDITRLAHLGIDFDSTTNHLTIKDSGLLATALGDDPDKVEALFMTSGTGLVGQIYSYITQTISSEGAMVSSLGSANDDIDEQIATLQSRLDQEREMLTSAFIRMLDAQSEAQSQSTYLTNTFFKDNSN
jgi:flagellar hook-associated protein 2